MNDVGPVRSVEVRARLVEALELDLVGPPAGHDLADELLPGWERPSNWYLTGFLIPTGTPVEQRGDDDESDELEVVPEAAGLSEESSEERKAAKRAYFPSSMGLSFLVPGEARELDVTVRWGDYEPDEVPRRRGQAAGPRLAQDPSRGGGDGAAGGGEGAAAGAGAPLGRAPAPWGRAGDPCRRAGAADPDRHPVGLPLPGQPP